MSGGVGTVGIVGAFLAGVAVGVGAMGWHTGAWTTTGAAADQTQKVAETAVKDAAEVGAQDAKAKSSAQRAQTVYIPVAKDCPPGAGPVSSDIAAELRQSFSQASASSSAREVGSGSATE